MTPSSPAPSKRRNQSSASLRSRVAGERWIGGAAFASASSSRARRCSSGVSRKSLSPMARRSHATNDAGVSSASIFTRDAAGWIRRSMASKSRPSEPAITTSPSTTHRFGNADASGATSSGKYRFIGFSSRLCKRMSSPSRNTSVLNPSHFGSKSQPSPDGNAAAAADNIGASGGSNGNFIAGSLLESEAPLPRRRTPVRPPPACRCGTRAGMTLRSRREPVRGSRHPNSAAAPPRPASSSAPVSNCGWRASRG